MASFTRGKARKLISFSVMKTRETPVSSAAKLAVSRVMSWPKASPSRDGRQQGASGVQHPEADAFGLFPKAVAPCEPGGAGGRARIDRFRRQGEVEQLAEHPPVALDELAVHPRNVHLAKVDTGARMVLEPADDVEQPGPVAGELQGSKRPLRHPGEQRGTPGAGPIDEAPKLAQLGLLAQERDGIFEGVHPRLVRQRVRAGDPVADFAHRDAHVRHGAQRRGPRPDLVEVISQLRGAWPPERQALGKRRLVRRHAREDEAAVPEPLDLSPEVRRSGPAGRTRHPASLAFSARYSSMDRLRNRENRSSSMWTKPTLATYGSMTWIF